MYYAVWQVKQIVYCALGIGMVMGAGLTLLIWSLA